MGRWIALGVAGFVLLLVAALALFGEDMTPRVLNPGFQSDATPAKFGVPFERLSIPSGQRHLDAFFVAAPSSCARRAAVLIYHGAGETVADWIGVQKLLRSHCIASLVFDYTGHGRSSPRGTVRRVNDDTAAAYAAFVAKTAHMRRCTFSFSMGAGPMLSAADRFAPAPDCVVVAAAFTSMRELMVRYGVPRWTTLLMPDSWDNTENIARLRVPVMILHSRTDRSDPFWMGETLFTAANAPKRLVPLKDFRHNAAYKTPSDVWWKPAIQFIQG